MLPVEPFGRIPWLLIVDLDPAFFQVRLQQINDFKSSNGCECMEHIIHCSIEATTRSE
ncbi:hypothetical protein [Streptomyces sp. URMC 124]|uniref:hypothetical protein n=1 Tax=Streptomyces sp. URMC 124 TaxID=3423405 RepID=UPI003F1A8FF4